MMTTVDTSRTAVRTLDEVDPDFRRLVDTLYGPAVDADTIWQDVYKANPDQADASPGGWMHKIAEGSAVAGGLLAGSELAGAGLRTGAGKAIKLRAGTMVPAAVKSAGNNGAVKATRSALGGHKAKVGLAGAALAGDAVTMAALRDKPKPQPVGKVSLGAHANGIGQKWVKMLPKAFKDSSGKVFAPTGKKVKAASGGASPQPISQARKNGAAATQLGSSFISTTTGKVLVGAGATKVGVDQYRKHKDKGANPADAYYGKSDSSEVEWAGEFSKFDDDKHLAFGWASVVKFNGLPVVDKQDDYIDPEDLETAAYDYVLKSRKGGRMHERDLNDVAVHVSDLVESVVFTDEKIAKMGLPDTMPRGWWIGVKVNDDEVWGEVKKGDLAGFSIHGKGRRRAHSVDDAMGYGR